MTDALDETILERLEGRARRRFVRWSPRLWQEILAGPGRALAEGLLASGRSDEAARKILETYLYLASEGIGRGFVFPGRATGTQAFLNLAWRELLPRLLPALPDERVAPALAACWNLGENLEGSPAWLRLIFTRTAAELESLDDLEGLVHRVSADAFEEPTEELAAEVQHGWVDLSAEDRRFLPGVAHFLAPTVACVHDRVRPEAALGVWLPADEPVVLGPTGCGAAPAEGAGDAGAPLWLGLAERDRRFDAARSAARNPWRAVASLTTSQMVVAVRPA